MKKNDFLHSVLTLDNDERWYITDQTEQGKDTYYLAVKINANNQPEAESKFFKKVKENGETFLDDQIDPETYQYLSSIFVTNYTNNTEEIAEKLKYKENDFLHSVLTLDNDERWYITDQTEQGKDIYYLAVKINANNQPEAESKIFKEVKENGKTFLDDQIDPETYQYLSAIFVTNYTNNTEEIAEKLKYEEVE